MLVNNYKLFVVNKTKIIKSIQYLFFFLLAITLLWFAFRGIDFAEILQDLKTANYFYPFLAVVLGTLSNLSRAVRWGMLIESIERRPLFKHTFYSMMIGYLANYAFPRIGEVTRCAVLGKKEKMPADKLLGTVLLERAIDMVILFVLVLILFFLRLDFFGQFFASHVIIPLGGKISDTFHLSWILYLSVFLFFIAVIVTLYFLRGYFQEIVVYKKTRSFVKNIIEGLSSVLKMKKKWSFFWHTLFIWVSYLLMTYCVFFSIPETSPLVASSPQLTIVDALFVLVLGGLAIAAPVQGAGIGAYHWIVAMGLTIYGISYEKGLVFATISHTSVTVMYLILGVISLIGMSMGGVKTVKNKISEDL